MSAYRAEKWVKEAAESILRQKLPWGWRLELLIGVDACANTLAEVRTIRDPRVVVMSMSTNGGTYRTLNTLLEHARGELVAVMDADDVSKAGRLEAEVATLVRDPGVSIVSGSYQNCDEKLVPVEPPTRAVSHGAMMTRRSFYDDLGGYKPWKCGADTDFITRVKKKSGRVILLDAMFLLRRMHPKSLCNAPETGRLSAARKFAVKEIEKEKARQAPTILRRKSSPHKVIRDQRRALTATGVGVVMPTIPGREETARAVVENLLHQGVDVIHVQANGHKVIPGWAQRERVVVTLNPPGTGPLSRFRNLPDTRIVLSVDDDIEYPSDYVSRTVKLLEGYGTGNALSFHGVNWDSKVTDHRYADRSLIAYNKQQDAAIRVTYIGCGCAAFFASDLWFMEGDEAPPQYAKEDDVWISGAAARTGVKLHRPSSPANWIKSTAAGTEGLWSSAVRDSFRRRDSLIAATKRMGVWLQNGRPSAPQQRRPAKHQGIVGASETSEQRFWGRRYAETGSTILSVGRRDVNATTNHKEYDVAMKQLQRLVRSDFASPAGISVLDIGYGLGHYARALRQIGVANYVGIDFASTSTPADLVSAGFSFLQRVDACEPDLYLGRTFDLVMVIDVMFHIIDEDRFAQACRNIRRHAKQLVYITGTFKDEQLAPHVKHRSAPKLGLGEPLSISPWRDNRIARFRVNDLAGRA